MKKFLCVLLIAALSVFALTACGGGGNKPSETGESQQSQPAAKDGYTFSYKDVELAVGAEFTADMLNALGEPKNYTEQTSCYFQGLDKTYYFGSFYLYVGAPENAPEYVMAIELVDDTVATKEGLSIGDGKDKVESLYGAEGFNGSNQYTVTNGNMNLIIQLSGDKVSSIQYHELTAE